MLCEVAALGNFWTTWVVLTLLGGVSITAMSGLIFARYYYAPTFSQWQRKLNPAFPTAVKVRLEILQMFKSLCAATLVPAATLYLAAHGRSRAYCGMGEGHFGLSAPAYLFAQFFVFWVVSDFYEWGYHQMGHRFSFLWNVHRHHHVFYNPTPFSVISDEAYDQLVRTAPLILIPLAVPTNMDLLFAQFAIFFYAYGVYLHWGYESDFLSAHQPWVNGSYEHCEEEERGHPIMHHALVLTTSPPPSHTHTHTLRADYHHAYSGGSSPIYTGFFFKLWDQLVGTVAKGPCKCSRCEVDRGARSLALWEKLERPDYSVLLSPTWWVTAGAEGEAKVTSKAVGSAVKGRGKDEPLRARDNSPTKSGASVRRRG